MDTVKNVIFIACVMGIISTIFDIAAPSGSEKKQLSVIVGVLTVIAVISPFTDSGFKLSLDEYEFDFDGSYYSDKFEYSEENALLSQAAERYAEYFKDKLNKNNIVTREVTAELSINDNDEVQIDKITICSEKGTAASVTELIREDLPEAEISVIEEDLTREDGDEALQHQN